MTLYRENYPPVDDGSTDVSRAEEAWHYVRWLKESGYLVPVEPCVHGRYDEHIHTPDGTTKYPTIVGQIETLTICLGAEPESRQ